MRFRRLKSISSFLVTVLRMNKLAWQVQPACFIVLFLLEIVQGLVPLVTAWLAKVLFDLLAASLGGRARSDLPHELFFVLPAQAGLVIMTQISALAKQYLNTELGRKLTLKIQTDVYTKIAHFEGLTYFEDPHFHDFVQLAVQHAQRTPIQALNALTGMGRSSVTLLSFLGVLIAFNPLLASAIGLTVLPAFLAQFKFGDQRFRMVFYNSPKERQASYYGQMLSSLPFAKEVRLFQLADHFLGSFVRLSQEVHHTERSQQKRELCWGMALAVLSGLVSSGAFIVVVLQAFAGHLSLGDVILYSSAVASVQSTLTSMIVSLSQMHESTLFYGQYRNLLALPQPLSVNEQARSIPPLREGIVFRNVSFRYSEQQPWILKRVNVSIPAGRCVALVGLNGAGKTTMVKLLARLYDPTEGEILWDGIDIREFDPIDLRRHMGSIFQDFVRYDLTVRENIGLGDVEQIEQCEAVCQAARKAGAHEMIEKLPQGYETSLSRWLTGKAPGVDLSGGEWQKIALARMFMRDVDLLMLDEPTAALDVQTEYDLYSRFTELMNGRTGLLITHRFSTVHMADIVVVLDQGQITEYGTHMELINLDGTYARLYNMQAGHYKEGDYLK